MQVNTAITSYERCLILALVANADFDAITGWLEDVGFTGYSVLPENVERSTLQLKDELLSIWEEDDES